MKFDGGGEELKQFLLKLEETKKIPWVMNFWEGLKAKPKRVIMNLQ